MRITLDKANVIREGNKFIIEMDSNQIAALMGSGKRTLGDLSPGETFKIGDEEFILLESFDEECAVIRSGFLDDKEFGDNSNWIDSPVRKYLNDKYYRSISCIIGKENIISQQRDLTSLDGLDDYGMCCDNVSMLTASEYAKYHKILGLKSNYSNWWWTITPASTPSNGYARYVCCVGSGGILYWGGCDFRYGVRPFLILKSSVLVS